MSKYSRYAHLLDLEAQRHLSQASIADNPAIGLDHCEVAVALVTASILLRKDENKEMAWYPKVGEKKTFVPEAFKAGLTVDAERSVTGEVIWVHPVGRFYVVRVESNGHSWNETFFMNE